MSEETVNPPHSSAAPADPAAAPDLRRGVVHTAGVVMQNIANFAPAIAVLFTVQQIA